MVHLASLIIAISVAVGHAVSGVRVKQPPERPATVQPAPDPVPTPPGVHCTGPNGSFPCFDASGKPISDGPTQTQAQAQPTPPACPPGEYPLKVPADSLPASEVDGPCFKPPPGTPPNTTPAPPDTTTPTTACPANMLPNDQGACVPPAAMCPPTGPPDCVPQAGHPSVVYESVGPSGQVNMYWSNGRRSVY